MTVPFAPDSVDVEEFLVAFFKEQSGLAGIHVGTRLPNDWAGDSLAIRTYRTGGGMDNHLPYSLDVARLDVDAFAPTKAEAWDLMKVARRIVLHDLIWADTTSLGAVVSDTTEYVGPQWFDEPDYPNAGRYLIQVSLDVRPTF